MWNFCHSYKNIWGSLEIHLKGGMGRICWFVSDTIMLELTLDQTFDFSEGDNDSNLCRNPDIRGKSVRKIESYGSTRNSRRYDYKNKHLFEVRSHKN